MTGAPSIALAFGGGGARGLAHIHVMEALDEMGIKPVAIAGSSIGAMMGAAMASGMTGREVRDYAQALLSNKPKVASRIWRAQRASLSSLLESAMLFGRLDAEAVLREFLPETIPATFEELKIPLLVTGTDFFGHRLTVFRSGALISTLAASVALPAVFRPVERDGMTLIDGGFFNPVPHDLLEGMADIVVAVDVVGVPHPAGRGTPSLVDLLYGATQLMMNSIIETKLQVSRPDVFLRPAVGNFRVLDFLKMDAIMRQTAGLKDEVKRELDRAISAHLSGRSYTGDAR